MKSSELLHEALLVYEHDRRDQDVYIKSGKTIAIPTRDPLIVKLGCADSNPEEFILNVIKSHIKASHLNDALISLPFTQVMKLIIIISVLSKKVTNVNKSIRNLKHPY